MQRLRSGYSLFELIILVVVLGVVCYFIFVNQSSFSGEAPEEMEMAAAEVVRVAIHNYAQESKRTDRTPVYPLALDEAADGAAASPQTPLFTTLFPGGLRSAWQKVRSNQYVYVPGARSSVTPSKIYYYDPFRGTFEKGRRSTPSRVT